MTKKGKSRRDELNAILDGVDGAKVITPLIDDIVFLEGKLSALRGLPFITYDKDMPSCQKTTPAAKQYKELLQQYSNCLKLVGVYIGKTDTAEGSPLRDFLQKIGEKK